MPKIKQLEKLKHPNSRKTKALAKQLKRKSTKDKSKLGTQIKQNLLGEKCIWFRDNLNSDAKTCSPSEVKTLILKYLGRFDEELEQIKLKHSIGQRKNRQHASREDIINMTLKREKEEFKTCGIEIPDLLNASQLNMLKTWNGELRFLQNFKLRRFSLQHLKEENEKIGNNVEKVKQEKQEISIGDKSVTMDIDS
ncbi:translation machinery-associated protein 16 homolog [Anthonomus grandis grandis]|uniref:translation machinery-associated protein 16 homolog n=1 Tax=Anthonomus grandis grandis TaxID=2921223 RepID=UPI0021660D98|nr:translation machinery-associated protein 16 homolog [Anthonomus grandis grandis]